MSITIPKLLLDTLEKRFAEEAKRVCKDAARILRRPEKELLALLKQMPKLKLSVADDSDFPTVCPIILQRHKILERCRGPCLLGTGRCLKHQNAPEPPEVPSTLQVLVRIQKCDELDTQLWCDETTRQVFDSSGTAVGELTEENVLELFTLEE